MKILFTCGGTAGHVNPALAVAQLIQERHRDWEIRFVGADEGMETRLIPKEGYPIETVTITNFHRGLSPGDIIHNLKTVWNIYRSRGQAQRILQAFQPDLVVGTGGYASFPVVKEAARRGIPTAIHESNAVPGLTTRALAGIVDCVMVGFEESRCCYAHPERVVVTGTPVRPGFFRYTREEARKKLGILDEKPILLSYWGSLGASIMNGHMLDFMMAGGGAERGYYHIHSAGRDFHWMQQKLKERGWSPEEHQVDLREYIYDMPQVMAAADVVLCRGGASTLSEITALNKAALIVPSPNVTANHQEKNARLLETRGGAKVLLESDCGNQRLFQETMELLHQPAKRRALQEGLSRLAVPDATQLIYQALERLQAT